MNWRNLMDSARGLAGQVEPQQPGRPRQEPLKKAVSAAYYAMFHALCRSNAETMTGRGTSPLSQRSWTRTYRALQHRQAKNRLLQVQQDLPTPGQQFATAFALLQERREAADYDPHLRLTRANVITLLNMAESATQEFMQMPGNERRAIATLVLLQERTIA